MGMKKDMSQLKQTARSLKTHNPLTNLTPQLFITLNYSLNKKPLVKKQRPPMLGIVNRAFNKIKGKKDK
jgi:hypothetical protein